MIKTEIKNHLKSISETAFNDYRDNTAFITLWSANLEKEGAVHLGLNGNGKPSIKHNNEIQVFSEYSTAFSTYSSILLTKPVKK